MEVISVPPAVSGQPQTGAGDIIFVDYKDQGGLFRNRVSFDCCAFSFVQNGQKHIYRGAENTVLKPGYGMLVPEGNCLITEHSDNAERYHSVIVFFPGSVGRQFIEARGYRQTLQLQEAPYLHFKTNLYIQEYVRNVRSLITHGHKFSPEMAVLKVQELLTAMYEMAPEILTAVFRPQGNLTLKNLVENNLLNPVTLDELAFLANRSLSSFKRDFQKEYGLPPQKYILDRRLEMARADLCLGKSASEIYLDYGYAHLPSFTAAFKRKFGFSPSRYQKAIGFERLA
ncbi:AraC-like DNA-binding protein [Pedobacter sp. AK017]|uniref:helix-turn-helix transcriptional regulator n=1 Tax=Pedobacter sp. AK017 TaxID=2723073 RepID=UPI00161AB554|nr:AraC family transcriptional regulator [Pedobacter sp. AK017]MBB5438339.1 AraC-like DNA-binding protein [Pedobacter sp. AK017]